MSQLCHWLHQQLETLPLLRYPFSLDRLPDNGIYFFYEDGETANHDSPETTPRIVRIGTHKDGNFRSRMSEHYLLKDEAKKMSFTAAQPAPHHRSIFRKNLGRVLLNHPYDPYLAIWELKFTSTANIAKNKHRRDIAKEKQIETEVTSLLRETFSFRFIRFEGEVKLIGNSGLESNLIGTVSRCKLCQPSPNWLGNHSPKPQITSSGLWLVQHLKSPELNPTQQRHTKTAITETLQWLKVHP